MNLSKILKNKIAKNAVWIIVGKIVQMVIGLLVSLITARYLGPSNFGLINYGTAYTAFFMSFCTLGINSIIVKEFVDNPEKEGEIIGTTLGLRAPSSLLSAIMIVCIVCMADRGEPTTILVVALCSVGLIFHILDTFKYWFQRKLKSKVTAKASLFAYICTALYRIILLINGKNVTWFAFALSLDYICFGIVLALSYFKHGGQRLSFSFSRGKKLLKKSSSFILSGMMVAIYGQTDKIMLKQMLTAEVAGYYSTAAIVSTMWCFILAAIIDSINPSIMESHNIDVKVYEKRNKQLYAIVFYLSVFVSAIITLLAKPIIYILYGESFMGAVLPLCIITWYTAFSYLGVARNAWIVCENKQKYLKYIYLVSALANVVLNLAFIPKLGASGAALASLITQIITIVFPSILKGMRRNSVLMLEAICLKGVFEKSILTKKMRKG